MNNYCGGPTWLQWVKQVLDKINEVIDRINNLTTDVRNVRQLPSGGSHGQVATPTEDGSGYEWVDQSGGFSDWRMFKVTYDAVDTRPVQTEQKYNKTSK